MAPTSLHPAGSGGLTITTKTEVGAVYVAEVEVAVVDGGEMTGTLLTLQVHILLAVDAPAPNLKKVSNLLSLREEQNVQFAVAWDESSLHLNNFYFLSFGTFPLIPLSLLFII